MKSRDNRTIGRLQTLIKRYHWWLAGGLLVLMFGLGVTSMAGNSAIIDEVAHIPSGYSYLHYGDYRLNPEHPPLMKELAGLPLQFMNLQFPDQQAAWVSQVNGQWDSGWSFLYYIGNNPDAIIFWARFPIFLFAIGFGAWLYWFARRRWGVAVALVSLGFYALSPNILAHATFVTTDFGALATMFMAVVAFAWFVEAPSGKRWWVLSLMLAVAELTKFSAVMLYPVLLIMSLGLVVVLRQPGVWWQRLRVYTGGLVAASAASLGWIWLWYTPLTWNMPTKVQDDLITGSVYGDTLRPVVQLLTHMNDFVVFKPLVQYLLGVAMVFNRVAGGNVVYFNGQVSDQSFHSYFPELFLFKTQVPCLILMALLVGLMAWWWRRAPRRLWWQRLVSNVQSHVLEWLLAGFGIAYFAIAVAGNLNLGLRHILPVYGPLFVLVAIGTIRLARGWRRANQTLALYGLVGLLAWYGLSTLAIAPHFISYFNELMGGPAQADKYFSDSNVDWGQDLKRFKTYMAEHPEIDKIAVDYFGGGSPQYYFCDRRVGLRPEQLTSADIYNCDNSRIIPWHSENAQYTGQYIAVSESIIEGDRWDVITRHRPGYGYLRSMTPIAKVGYSIYVYKLY